MFQQHITLCEQLFKHTVTDKYIIWKHATPNDIY